MDSCLGPQHLQRLAATGNRRRRVLLSANWLAASAQNWGVVDAGGQMIGLPVFSCWLVFLCCLWASLRVREGGCEVVTSQGFCLLCFFQPELGSLQFGRVGFSEGFLSLDLFTPEAWKSGLRVTAVLWRALPSGCNFWLQCTSCSSGSNPYECQPVTSM